MTDAVLIDVHPSTAADASLWHLTGEVAGVLGALPWVLIGGQMVAILEAEHGAQIGFATADVDAVVDVRAFAGATFEAARRLVGAGFEPATDGARGYRFLRGEAMVDVLAPDHVGSRADLRTIPPDSTIEVGGGSQALARARTVEVDIGDERFRVRIPTLAGAIVIKSHAAGVAQQGHEKHERDLARLLAIVPDVAALRSELTPGERGHLARHRSLMSVSHSAWGGVIGAQDGATALAFVLGTGVSETGGGPAS